MIDLAMPGGDTPEIDFAAQDCGSICLIEPLTDSAREALPDLFGDEPLMWAGAVVCEPRYFPEVLAGLLDNGWNITLGGRQVLAIEVEA